MDTQTMQRIRFDLSYSQFLAVLCDFDTFSDCEFISTMNNFFNYLQSRQSRIPSEKIRIILTCRLFVVFSTAIILIVYLILGLFSSITLPTIIIVEYGVVALTWLAYAIVWILAIEHNTWPRPPSLIVAYNICVLSLFIVTYQRIKHFGYWDPHCFGVAFIFICHLVNVFLQFVEWRKARQFFT